MLSVYVVISVSSCVTNSASSDSFGVRTLGRPAALNSITRGPFIVTILAITARIPPKSMLHAGILSCGVLALSPSSSSPSDVSDSELLDGVLDASSGSFLVA